MMRFIFGISCEKSPLQKNAKKNCVNFILIYLCALKKYSYKNMGIINTINTICGLLSNSKAISILPPPIQHTVNQ